jgi:hypothetical protein
MIAATARRVKRGRIVPFHGRQLWSRVQTGAHALLGLLATLAYNVLSRLDRLLHNFEEVKTCRRIA